MLGKGRAWGLLSAPEMKRAVGVLGLLLAACGPVEEGERDEPSMEARLRRTEGPTVFALVLDDANDVPAAELRRAVVSALGRSFRATLFGERGACRDPAAACPIDLRVVLARSSAEPGDRIVGPATRPALRWSSQWATESALDAFLQGLPSMMDEALAPEGPPHRPLEAADDLLRLLGGLRSPRSSAEAALVADYARDEPWIDVIVASARDDASPLPPAAYVPASTTLRWLATVAGPGSADSEPCAPHGVHGRLGEWAAMASWTGLALPCDDPASFDEALRLAPGPSRARCTAHPLAKSDDGRVDCRIWTRSPEDQGCEASGWLDPEGEDGIRRPRFEHDEEGRRFRICELPQHEGERLEACRTILDCPECGSGYCQTEVSELVADPASCDREGGHPLNLRFTGEALLGASEIVVRCRPALAE